MNTMLRMYDEKLKELMPEDEYRTFVAEVAKAAFRAEVANMPESEFKDLCLEQMEAILDETRIG